jgi:hypothetical protein
MCFIHGSAIANCREARQFYAEHYPQRRISSPKSLTRLYPWQSESGTFPHSHRIAESLDYFELPIWKIAYWGDWNRILKPVCEELQLLKVSVFPFLRRFPINNHFTYNVQRVQILTGSHHYVRVVLCRRFFTKCIVNTKFANNMLLTPEVGFTTDDSDLT